MITATIIVSVFYLVAGILLHLGLNRRYPRQEIEPTVTVLVAARNEELNLPRCLESLSQLDYPVEKLHVMVLNDRSNDATGIIAHDFTKRFPFIRVLDISEDLSGLRGKMNALAQGINHSSGDIIMITDADCIVSRDWVRETVQYFDHKTGMVAGMTLIDSDFSNKDIC